MLSSCLSFQGRWTSNRHATGRYHYPRPFWSKKGLHGVVEGILDRDLPLGDAPAHIRPSESLGISFLLSPGLWDAV